MRSEGTMRVAIFESYDAKKPEGLRVADLLGEAAEWLRSRCNMDVQIGPKKRGRQEIYEVKFHLDRVQSYGEDESQAETFRLFVFHDSNEYQGKET